MNRIKSKISINVDLLNPGQFFACCGLFEVSNKVYQSTLAYFDEEKFNLISYENDIDLHEILKVILNSKVVSLNKGDKTSPISFKGLLNMTINWWIDEKGNKSRLGKLFAGQKSTTKDATRIHECAQKYFTIVTEENIYDISEPLNGRFGVDPRSSWEALDVGFSPNNIKVPFHTYIYVELLAALGLQNFKPKEIDGMFFYYGWRKPLPLLVARVIARGLIPELTLDKYRFVLNERGSLKAFSYAIKE